ncbi:MAG: class I SAM-dependent methyltransferase [Myxococcales bacterium]|nr:class I SAM-dependent methyltransferase [Myxococcales bacterium]
MVAADAPHIASAVANAARAPESRERDAERRPAEILALAGIRPGMRVADLASGRGYWAEILAGAVGESGSVVLHNPPYVLERFGDMGVPALLAKPHMANTRALVAPLDGLPLERGAYDAVFLGLFYHDLYWQGTDRAAMNAAIRDALAPGGVFVVIDHRAEAGSGARDAKTLHRIDESEVRRDVERAGFALAAQSDVLARSGDDRAKSVFDDAVRGHTDRFVFVFRRSADADANAVGGSDAGEAEPASAADARE